MKEIVNSDSLASVLTQSEQVESIVEKCADEISSVNHALSSQLAGLTTPSLAAALGQNERVESKVGDASDKLADVNKALKTEVFERRVLEDRLSAALAQSEQD